MEATVWTVTSKGLEMGPPWVFGGSTPPQYIQEAGPGVKALYRALKLNMAFNLHEACYSFPFAYFSPTGTEMFTLCILQGDTLLDFTGSQMQ